MKTDEIEFDNHDENDINSTKYEIDKDKLNLDKIDVRRKLEDYLEQKRLEKELYDY